MSDDLLPFDVLRNELVQRVKAAAIQLNLPIKLPNAPWRQPEGVVFGEYMLMVGGTKQAELGGGDRQLERTVGVFQIDVLAPEDKGDGEAWRVANKLKKLFNRITVQMGAAGYFKLDVVSAKSSSTVKAGFLRLIVDAGIDFYHRGGAGPLGGGAA